MKDFKNAKFISWLNQNSENALSKFSKGEALSNNEEAVLILKAWVDC